MKKKFLTVALTAIMGLSMSSIAWAESDPENISDYYGLNQVIPSSGRIGLDYEEGEDGEPEIDAETMIAVLVPRETTWFVSQYTHGYVQSPTFRIRNKSPRANLNVTFESYEQTGGTPVGGLTLNLTEVNEYGEGLRDIWTNIIETTGHRHSSILGSIAEVGGTDFRDYEYGDKLAFQFTGRFTGQMTVEALQPQYDMTLQFSVDSYTIPAQANNN